MSVETKVDNVDALVKSVEQLTKREVLVGIPAENAYRPGDPVSNALIGYINEKGSPANNIPARPFLLPAVRHMNDRIINILWGAAKKIGAGAKPEEAERALNAVGLLVSTDAKKNITAVIPPPLRPATLAARRRKGFTGTTPLIVTGSFLRSITYVIRPKE